MLTVAMEDKNSKNQAHFNFAFSYILNYNKDQICDLWYKNTELFNTTNVPENSKLIMLPIQIIFSFTAKICSQSDLKS